MNDEQQTPGKLQEGELHAADAPAAPETTEVAALRAQLTAREARERMALDQFRTALLATEPEMDPGLVTGDSFETIHASFGAARSSLARVREALRQESVAQVPMGAPGRTPQRHRTALEKIRDGLSSA